MAGHDWGTGDQRIFEVYKVLALLVKLCKLPRYNTDSIFVFLIEPWVFKGLFSRDSHIRVFSQKLCDEVFGLRRNTFPLTVIKLVVTFHVLFQDFFRRVALEKRTTGQNDVENDADAENVSLAVVTLFL